MSGSRVHFSPWRVISAVTCPIIWFALLTVASGSRADAQHSDSPGALPQPTGRDQTEHPSLDVASIHPDNADHTARTHIYSYSKEGHFIAINATPLQLMQYAYALPDSRILAIPEWARSSKYDIEGKSDPVLVDQLAGLSSESAKAKLLEMVQTLLNDRFHLAAHREKHDLPVYILIVAKGGPKLVAAKNDGSTIDSGTHNGIATIKIGSSSRAITDLAEILPRYVGRVVVDQTGLKGNFTVGLRFSAEDSSSSPGRGTNSSVDDRGPSVFMALREQLGLELKSGKAPVDVLVIDHVELPTEN
jgi:uncharacterized protein (TIGR03435 family)